MTLNDIISPLIKWWWLILLSTLIAAASSYYVSSQQPAVYQSSATLMIGSAIQDPNPSSGELYLEQQLASTYANIANRTPIRQATMQSLGLEWLPEYHVAALPNSQLIQIIVIDTYPERAQAVAWELANQLILQSPSGISPDDQDRREFVENQLNDLQNQIIETQSEIESLQIKLGELNSARQIADTQEQIRALGSVLGSLQSNYASLLANTAQGATNTLELIEEPNLPTRPSGPNSIMTVFLSAAVGFSLGAAGAYLLEFLDKSVKSIEDAAEIIQAPVVGTIPNIPKNNSIWEFVSEQPRSPISDAFRSLRTNLEFTKPTGGLKTILVTSPTIAEGKSTISSNLARIISQTDKNVILLDADLRKSTVQEFLEIPDKEGLSNLLSNQVQLSDTLIPLDNENISLIPAGHLPPNPTELLGSITFDHVLEQLKDMADIIIIDAPPFIVTDAAILSAKVDGILIVIQPGTTTTDAIKAMTNQLRIIDTPILGVVANRNKKTTGYYSDYYSNQ